MRSRMKTILITLFTLLLFGVQTLNPSAVQAQEADFSGSRSFSWVIDGSDLDNYVNGGRNAYDLAIRYSKPKWLQYEIRAAATGVETSFTFDFASFDDYLSKVTVLLGYEPAIIQIEGDKFIYSENFESAELFGFMDGTLQSLVRQTEFSSEELFHPGEASFLLNGNLYDASERITIRGAEEVLQLDLLEIVTRGQEGGTLVRRITAGVLDSSPGLDKVASLVGQFTMEGLEPSVEKGVISLVILEFEVDDYQELMRLTMLALNTGVTVRETTTISDKPGIAVDFQELLDADRILTEHASCQYSFYFPDHYQNVSIPEASADLSLSADSISYSGRQPVIEFHYESDFRFHSIVVSTDMTNALGKVKRTIRLTAPTDSAIPFHLMIRQQLEEKLQRGMTLTIDDLDGDRYYEISFASWFPGDLAVWTEAILGKGQRLELKRRGLPFQRSTLSETITAGDILKPMAPPLSVEARYLFPANVRFLSLEEHLTTDGQALSHRGRSKTLATQLVYAALNPVTTGALLLGLIFAGLLSFFFILMIRKRRKNKRQESFVQQAGT